MKSIMYHYIQDFDYKKPYFTYLNYKNFEKQINYFKHNYNFFDCNNFNFFKGLNNINNKIFLTFDDGLSCHFKYVLKILKKNKLNAIFYIPAQPYLTKKILNVHKIHLILGTFGEKKSCKLLDKYISKKMLDESKKYYYLKNTYKKQKNSNLVNKFKRTFNYFIKNEYRDVILDKIFLKLFENNEEKILKNYYLNEKQIKTLVSSGMVIGAHSVSHPLLSKLNKKEFTKEIDNSFKFINLFYKQKTFSYPYGGFHSFNSSIEEYLNSSKVTFSMNTESRNITKKDLLTRPQALPRYNCNEFKFGQIDDKEV